MRLAPAAHLLELVPVPACDPCETNADLLGHALDLRAALARANADKAAIAAAAREDQ